MQSQLVMITPPGMASTVLVKVTSYVKTESTKLAIVSLRASPSAETVHRSMVPAVFRMFPPSVLRGLYSTEMDCALLGLLLNVLPIPNCKAGTASTESLAAPPINALSMDGVRVQKALNVPKSSSGRVEDALASSKSTVNLGSPSRTANVSPVPLPIAEILYSMARPVLVRSLSALTEPTWMERTASPTSIPSARQVSSSMATNAAQISPLNVHLAQHMTRLPKIVSQ